MSKRRKTFGTLRRKTLQLPNLGKIVYGLVQNSILGGNLDIKRHFKIVLSPSLTSAQEAVRLGKAEVVFAPLSSKGLLPLVSKTVFVPPPAFVALDKTLSKQIIEQATQVVFSWGELPGAIAGWTGGNAVRYLRLAASSTPRHVRMILVPIRQVWPRTSDLVNSDVVKYELPNLDELYQVP
jgi:hypothetical protein